MDRRLLALVALSLVHAIGALAGLAVVVLAHERLFPGRLRGEGSDGRPGAGRARGPSGPPGPVGPEAEDAIASLEGDLADVSGRVDELEALDIETTLEQLSSDIRDVADRVESICSQLSLSSGVLYDIYVYAC